MKDIQGDFTFEELLAMGADCTGRLADGSTALMYASMGGNLALIRKLLANGADLYARQASSRRVTAIELARTPLVRRYLEKVAARDSKKLADLDGASPAG
jgi:ankyrin repeat protein